MAMNFTVTAGTTCILKERPTAIGDGTPQLRYRAVYFVETPEGFVVPGQAAIQLGRVNGPERIPARGAAFDLTIHGTRFRDPSVFALDFTAFPVEGDEDCPHLWAVEVVWRQPVWGQDEVPRTASRPPWQRAREFKWDWMDEQDAVSFGRIVTQSDSGAYSAASNAVPMLNTAGEPIAPEVVRDRVLVGRLLFNSTDPLEPVRQTDRYKRTVNSNKFRLRGLTIDKHYAKFLGCENLFAGVYNGIDYFRGEMRIQIGNEPWYTKRVSQGKVAFTAGGSSTAEKREQPVDTRGLPRGVVQLNANGQPADANYTGSEFDTSSNPPATQRWLVYRPVKYTIGL